MHSIISARQIRRMSLAVGLLFAPVAWSPGEGVVFNSACADDGGTCCRDTGSYCYIGEQVVENAYYNGVNRCPPSAD